MLTQIEQNDLKNSINISQNENDKFLLAKIINAKEKNISNQKNGKIE